MNVEMKADLQIDTNYYKVVELRELTENTFVLSLPKSRFKFEAGNIFRSPYWAITRAGNTQFTVPKKVIILKFL